MRLDVMKKHIQTRSGTFSTEGSNKMCHFKLEYAHSGLSLNSNNSIIFEKKKL